MSTLIIEKKRTECSALPKGWQREEVVRKTGLAAGKVDIFYYSPNGKKFHSKPQLARYLGEHLDLSTFDYRAGKINTLLLRKAKRQRGTQFDYWSQRPLGNRTRVPDPLAGREAHPSRQTPSTCIIRDSSRGMRNDASLVPPIRQTASIFKQPVTVHKNQEGKVKTDFKHGNQEKPKQLFWEKRLEGMRACDISGSEFDSMDIPKLLKPVGPHVKDETMLQSVATALHVSTQPVTGQTGSKTALDKNPGVFLNPDQPLVQNVTVTDEDIKKQEDRVDNSRKRLKELLWHVDAKN